MICPICKTRFADYPEEDFILDLPAPPGKGIIAKSKEGHERRMKVFWNNDERFCSEECSDAFLNEQADISDAHSRHYEEMEKLGALEEANEQYDI